MNILLPLLLTSLLASAGDSFSAEGAVPRPNILVILTDDIGWGDYGCYNPNSKVPTPNIDRLAREGMRFTHAHTPAGLCAPTRYSMLTGNYPRRGRVPGGTWGINVPSQLKPGQETVAKMLQRAGYRTAMFGKAGTGGFYANSADAKPAQPLAPTEWGFDYSYLIPKG
jgi:arylsulfatase A